VHRVTSAVCEYEAKSNAFYPVLMGECQIADAFTTFFKANNRNVCG